MPDLSGYDDTTARAGIAGLAGRMPVANQRVQDAIARQQQQNIAKLAGGAYTAGAQVTPGAVSAGGAQIAQAAGQQAVAGQQAGQQMAAAGAGAALTGMGQQAANATTEAGLGTASMQRDVETRMSDLSIGLKKQLVDDRMAFGRDENGRQVMDTQQMADFAVTKAKDSTDLQRYQQIMDQATKKHIQMLRAMQAQFQQTLQSKTSKEIQDMEQQTGVDLYRATKDLGLQIQARETELANRSMQYGAAGGLIGMAIGAVAGGPGGAAAGGKAGQSVGTGATYL